MSRGSFFLEEVVLDFTRISGSCLIIITTSSSNKNIKILTVLFMYAQHWASHCPLVWFLLCDSDCVEWRIKDPNADKTKRGNKLDVNWKWAIY